MGLTSLSKAILFGKIVVVAIVGVVLIVIVTLV